MPSNLPQGLIAQSGHVLARLVMITMSNTRLNDHSYKGSVVVDLLTTQTTKLLLHNHVNSCKIYKKMTKCVNFLVIIN